MANEKRLIYAGDAHRAILEAEPKLAYCIERIKGVEAVEVVHGRWVRKEIRELLWSSIVPHCSVCNALKIQDKWNYCPNCGAKMDGDGNG